MVDHEKKPAQGGQLSVFQESKPSRLAPGTKKYSVLFTLVHEGPLDCFQAVRKCHDYVLRSTVSDLQRDLGIRIDRVMVEVPNSFGGKTRCARYFVAGDQRAKAYGALYGEAAR